MFTDFGYEAYLPGLPWDHAKPPKTDFIKLWSISKSGKIYYQNARVLSNTPFISTMGQRGSQLDQVQARKAQVQLGKHCPSSFVLGHPKARLVSAARKLIEPNTTTPSKSLRHHVGNVPRFCEPLPQCAPTASLSSFRGVRDAQSLYFC